MDIHVILQRLKEYAINMVFIWLKIVHNLILQNLIELNWVITEILDALVFTQLKIYELMEMLER
jgi:hypothetical protein